MCPPGDPDIEPGSPINPGVLSCVLPSTYFYVMWRQFRKSSVFKMGTLKPGVMAHSGQLEAGGPGVRGQPLPHETLSLKTKKDGGGTLVTVNVETEILEILNKMKVDTFGAERGAFIRHF